MCGLRILLCDHHRLLIDALSSSLRKHDHEVVALATSLEETYEAILDRDPDVCILDVDAPDGDGMEMVERIRSTTRCKILVLSAKFGPDPVRRALTAGASGYLSKDHGVEDVLMALDRLSAGQAPQPGMVRAAVRANAESYRPELDLLRFLTAREREALRRITEGESTKEIAQSMHVAYSTARTHVQNVLTKLGVRSQLQAAAFVARAGVVVELGEDAAPAAVALVSAAGSGSYRIGSPPKEGGRTERRRERCQA